MVVMNEPDGEMPVRIVEMDEENRFLADVRADGSPLVIGDARREALLDEVNIAEARAIEPEIIVYEMYTMERHLAARQLGRELGAQVLGGDLGALGERHVAGVALTILDDLLGLLLVAPAAGRCLARRAAAGVAGARRRGGHARPRGDRPGGADPAPLPGPGGRGAPPGRPE